MRILKRTTPLETRSTAQKRPKVQTKKEHYNIANPTFNSKDGSTIKKYLLKSKVAIEFY